MFAQKLQCFSYKEEKTQLKIDFSLQYFIVGPHMLNFSRAKVIEINAIQI